MTTTSDRRDPRDAEGAELPGSASSLPTPAAEPAADAGSSSSEAGSEPDSTSRLERTSPMSDALAADQAPDAAVPVAATGSPSTSDSPGAEGSPSAAPAAATGSLSASDSPAAEGSSDAAAPSAAVGDGPLDPSLAFRIALPNFEGPLDLLLHLIREHKIDIFDIPISLITEKYLAAIRAMKEMNLDIAGEFILMAATLAHIKSRMLLPDPEPLPEEEEPQADPREELVKRLLQYQKYRAAAEELARQDLLDRDVFTRRARMEQIPLAEGEVGLVEVSVFKLIEALDRVMSRAKIVIPHQVLVDRVSLSEAITGLIERLKTEPRSSFRTFLGETPAREHIVLTFLALLEMCKLGLIRVFQEEDGGDILVSARDPDALGAPAAIKDDYK